MVLKITSERNRAIRRIEQRRRLYNEAENGIENKEGTAYLPTAYRAVVNHLRERNGGSQESRVAGIGQRGRGGLRVIYASRQRNSHYKSRALSLSRAVGFNHAAM